MLDILLLTVGGTIDKVYGSGTGVRDLEIGAPFAPSFLKGLIGPHVRITHKELMRKDSLDMTNEDRDKIFDECSSGRAARIILITHGTDTMIKTASVLALANEGAQYAPPRTIVLTGALQPAVMKESDAQFQLGLALSTCLIAPPEVYIAMNGVYLWNKCRKHCKTGMFHPV